VAAGSNSDLAGRIQGLNVSHQILILNITGEPQPGRKLSKLLIQTIGTCVRFAVRRVLPARIALFLT
jgi:hypothetical protein